MSDGVVQCPVLVTAGGTPAPLRGGEMGSFEIVHDAALAWSDGLITYAGPRDDLPAGSPTPQQVGGAVVPGFVDCHTHLPFMGWRADEFEARLAGRTYRDIHGGGGIFRSARMLAEVSQDDVLAFCRPLVAQMLAHGTTTFEMKTGYGLSVEAELRQAWIARQLSLEVPQTTTVTLLGCHAIPPDRSREEWVDEVCEQLIPQAVADDLADAVDIYVEDIAFSLEDLARVTTVARSYRLPVRCHADQLGPSGATEAAASLGARSADHLNHISPEGIRALAGAETAAVLLPVSTLFLRAQPPPVANLMAAGAAIALSTDFNPGTSPCLSIPEAISVAASLYRLPTLWAIGAATLNAAWVLGLDESLGSLEPGKRADFVVLDSEDPAMIAYRPGHNPVAETWIAGERVWPAG